MSRALNMAYANWEGWIAMHEQQIEAAAQPAAQPSPVSPRQVSDETLALVRAVVSGSLPEVKAALAAGADPDIAVCPREGKAWRTLVQHAIMTEHRDILHELIGASASLEAVTSDVFWPPAHLATMLENRPAVDTLNAFCANFDLAVLDPVTGETSTARQIAARKRKDFADWFGARMSLSDVGPHAEIAQPEQAAHQHHRPHHRRKH